MKKGKIAIIICSLIAYTLLYISLSHILTIKKMDSLRHLKGTTISQNDLKKKIPKSFHFLNDSLEIRKFSEYMKVQVPENVSIIKVSGKGIPYYYGLILYDTLKREIKDVSLKEMK